MSLSTLFPLLLCLNSGIHVTNTHKTKQKTLHLEISMACGRKILRVWCLLHKIMNYKSPEHFFGIKEEKSVSKEISLLL